jgi:hypothetical protein
MRTWGVYKACSYNNEMVRLKDGQILYMVQSKGAYTALQLKERFVKGTTRCVI